MQRLNFRLDEFVRVSWVSKEAQEKWAPIFSDLSNKFLSIEREMVLMGMRYVALQQTNDLLALTKLMMFEGLQVVPLEQVNVLDHYSSASKPFDPTLPSGYKVVIGKTVDVKRFAVAYDLHDHSKIGMLLGYPTCCTDFFKQYWVQEQWFDTTLPMIAYRSDEPVQTLHGIDPRNNILLRWLGLRPVSHLPCSFVCDPTREIADRFYRAAINLKMETEWQALLEILSWPIEWNSLHGIAQIITPVCKITTATDALPTKKVIRIVSEHMPDETGSGIDFPFIQDTWSENGFKSKQSMDRAHTGIVEALRPLNPSAVLDLGCGNMELLYRLNKEFGCSIVGVDQDAEKQPDVVSNIYDFEVGDTKFDVALCALQRVVEDPDRWENLIQRLAKNVKHLLMYDYTNNAIEVRPL